MAKRRKRRSQKSFDTRLMKDIRRKRIEFLREISAMVSNAVGFKGRFVPDKGEVVMQKPKRKGKVTRKVAHVAGYGSDDAPPEIEAGPDLPDDNVGF